MSHQSTLQGDAAPLDAPLEPQAVPRFYLGTWINGVVLVTLLCAMLTTVWLVESFARRHAERAATAQLTQLAWSMRDALDRGMSQNLEQMRALATLSLLRDSDDRDAVRAMLDEVKGGFAQLAWIGLADTDGRVTASAGRLLEGRDVSGRPWFQGAARDTYVGDVHAATLLGALLPAQEEPWRFVDIAVPVFDLQGRRRATLGAHRSWDWAKNVRRELLDPSLRDQQAEVLVIARDGTVLIGPKGLEGKTIALPTSQPDDVALLAATLDAAATAGAIASTPPDRFGRRHVNGQPMFTVCSSTRGSGRFAGLGWTVVVRQPEAVALADFARLRNEIVAAGALVFVVFCLVASYVSRRLAMPLRRMARAARADMPQLDVDRVGVYQEAYLLAVALNDMVHRQRAHADELAAINESLEVRIEARTRDLVSTNQQLRDAQTLLRGVTDNLPVLIAYIDTEQRLRFYNATYEKWFGIDQEVHVGRLMKDVVGLDLYEPRRPMIERALTGEHVVISTAVERLGVRRDIESHYVPHFGADGRVLGLYALSTDVTELKANARKLEQLARSDTLTGLPNRLSFDERLPEALARGRRSGLGIAVLFVDIDHFKQVNDRFGHATGDALLKTFAFRLKEGVRETDTVARLAGDEFVLILEGLHDDREASAMAAQVLGAICKPAVCNGAEIDMSASVGVAWCGDCRTDADEILARADRALYQSKEAGRRTFRLLSSNEAASA
ncbi:MAG: hypothetical protein JWQ11_1544 [Rhizobacter sp.]|nr:hypothetical protein [Rhizobacter sp.]